MGEESTSWSVTHLCPYTWRGCAVRIRWWSSGPRGRAGRAVAAWSQSACLPGWSWWTASEGCCTAVWSSGWRCLSGGNQHNNSGVTIQAALNNHICVLHVLVCFKCVWLILLSVLHSFKWDFTGLFFAKHQYDLSRHMAILGCFLIYNFKINQFVANQTMINCMLAHEMTQCGIT